MHCDLSSKRCVPCEGGIPALTGEELQPLLQQVPDWNLAEDKRISRDLVFDDFVALMRFVNRMADLAEDEGHHPDFTVHYNKLHINVWTHAVGGLSENDFILAAKIDGLLAA